MKTQKIKKQPKVKEPILPTTQKEEDLKVTREEAIIIAQSLIIGTERFKEVCYQHGIPDETCDLIIEMYSSMGLSERISNAIDEVTIARLMSTITDKESKWCKKWKWKMIWCDFRYHILELFNAQKLMDKQLANKKYYREKFNQVGKDGDFFLRGHRTWEKMVRRRMSYGFGLLITIISIISFIQFLRLIHFI